MNTFDFHIDIHVPPQRVLSAFWRLEEWPEIAKHVVSIDMTYEDPAVQVLDMIVDTKGRLDRFQTVRILKGSTIYYFQPTPPPLLKHHQGSWIVKATREGSRVTSVHTLEVDKARARSLLNGDGEEGERSYTKSVEKMIKRNSLQTMRALKARLECALPNSVVRHPTEASSR